MILNLYKPKGISSFNFINKVKKISGYKKVGHAGTLDPLAEGVLVVLTDQDTKKQDSYMKQDKVYEAEILLGTFSESFDLEKPLVFSEKVPQITQNQVIELLESLYGELTLPAPIYSAKLISGKRLYKYANQGIKDIDLPKVTSKIDKIKLISISNINPLSNENTKKYPLIKIEVSCSSGTYIRSLANYIGEKLGTKGVLYSLIRTQVGDFRIENSTKLTQS